MHQLLHSCRRPTSHSAACFGDHLTALQACSRPCCCEGGSSLTDSMQLAAAVLCPPEISAALIDSRTPSCGDAAPLCCRAAARRGRCAGKRPAGETCASAAQPTATATAPPLPRAGRMPAAAAMAMAAAWLAWSVRPPLVQNVGQIRLPPSQKLIASGMHRALAKQTLFHQDATRAA